jgi:predicted nuclease of predicted toxin-antitoxin system
MRIIIDMNLSPGWADFLNNKGFEASHWSVIGHANAADPLIMGYARQQNAVILTSDLDFGSILAASGGRAPSVVQIRSGDLSTENIGRQILAALVQTEDALNAGALVTVEPARMRLTWLPIER